MTPSEVDRPGGSGKIDRFWHAHLLPQVVGIGHFGSGSRSAAPAWQGARNAQIGNL
jgi:hypothetical protein